jgi:hypothetical protein
MNREAAAPCRLCNGSTDPLFELQILGRHTGRYRQCRSCGLTQTQEPHWLEEAYKLPIHPTDTGLLARNIRLGAVVSTFLHLSGVHDEPVIDEAGGYGVLTRLLRDSGFQAYWHDPYASNVFAQGFEWRDDLGAPVAVTAFEVLEHLVHPRQEFERLAARNAKFIITSTEIHPGERPAADWPYLSPASGQHVVFYRADTLRRLGGMCGYPRVIAGPFLQVFARRPFPAWRWHAAVRLATLIHPLVRKLRRSLTVPDSETLRRGPDRGRAG